ncbi:hypothetical protein PCANC_26165 [Puccinia coronata f. sp. avenae]|uniref:Uncharacterized protein n=1 Tax=Puccinia coronata f. sp. avenae TaxID=200324 RepID=A0A2N5S2H2_9BASI|nr:hypothetical protein PCANC_26165 [Puccinia coronata f. sp. avenae]
MCCTIPLDIDRWTGSGLAMKFFSLTTYNPFPPLVSKRLNLVLLSLIEKLSQPELIHSILLAQLRPSAPIVPAAEQNPIPEIPSLQQEETEQYHHVVTIRSSIDQLSSFFHTLLLCLLRLPTFLGALIHHITLQKCSQACSSQVMMKFNCEKQTEIL